MYNTLKRMTVGTEGYIEIEYDYFILTKPALFIDLDTPILNLKCLKEKIYPGIIKIRRIGEGIADKDFEIDVTSCEHIEFFIEPMSVYRDIMEEEAKWGKQYVIFPYTSCIKLPSIEILKERLKEALEIEDFLLAAQLRNEIKEKEKTKH